jgi:hypothetical protein
MSAPTSGTPPQQGVRLSRRLFLAAGVYGLLVLVPQYFMEGMIAREDPPAITHPEYFYGFVGVAAAWQLVYLVIASDPIRYRPLMLLAVLAKGSFGIAVAALHAAGRVAGTVLAFASVDLVLGVLFLVAFWRTQGAADWRRQDAAGPVPLG